MTKTLADWQHEIGTWTLATFGPGDRFHAHVEHLRRELLEMERAWLVHGRSEMVSEELVDLLILTLGLAHRLGIDLESGLGGKHAVNLARRWQAPDEQGVTEHVRSEH